jgi:hypothetical protein
MKPPRKSGGAISTPARHDVDLMKRTLFFAVVVFVLARAGLFEAPAQPNDTRLVHAFLAKDKGDKPTRIFSADVPSIYLIWKGERLKAGDEIRVIWVAEDVGERSVKVYKPDENGAISLSRPNGRVWPAGQYRTELYLGEKLVEAVRFTIQPGVNVEVH